MAIDSSKFIGNYRFNSPDNAKDEVSGHNLTFEGGAVGVGVIDEGWFMDGIDDTAYNTNIVSDLANLNVGTIVIPINVDTVQSAIKCAFSVDYTGGTSTNSFLRILTERSTAPHSFSTIKFNLNVSGVHNINISSSQGIFTGKSGYIPMIITQDGSLLRMYFDGVLVKTISNTAWFKAIINDSAFPADKMTIGALRNHLDVSSLHINTTFDNVIISSQVWGQTEVDEFGDGKEFVVSVNSLTVGTATAIDNGTHGINVSMPYTNDDNSDSTYTIDYKLSSDSTYTNWVTEASNTPSPYTDTIVGLQGAEIYDVQCTYIDPDGTTGTNPQTISNIPLEALPNKVIPKIIKSEAQYKIIKNDDTQKIVKRINVSKVIK